MNSCLSRRVRIAAMHSPTTTNGPSGSCFASATGSSSWATGSSDHPNTLPPMSPQRRTALFSVFAACALIALKLGTGLATHSLGLVSEAIHSGTDLVAALLTFFAVGVAVRPADSGHQYGHGKAEHLASLAEAAFLLAASVFIIVRAVMRLASANPHPVNVTWWSLLVIGIVIAVDVGRTAASRRAAR